MQSGDVSLMEPQHPGTETTGSWDLHAGTGLVAASPAVAISPPQPTPAPTPMTVGDQQAAIWFGLFANAPAVQRDTSPTLAVSDLLPPPSGHAMSVGDEPAASTISPAPPVDAATVALIEDAHHHRTNGA